MKKKDLLKALENYNNREVVKHCYDDLVNLLVSKGDEYEISFYIDDKYFDKDISIIELIQNNIDDNVLGKYLQSMFSIIKNKIHDEIINNVKIAKNKKRKIIVIFFIIFCIINITLSIVSIVSKIRGAGLEDFLGYLIGSLDLAYGVIFFAYEVFTDNKEKKILNGEMNENGYSGSGSGSKYKKSTVYNETHNYK